MEHQLFDLGYQTIKDVDLLVQVAGILDAVVLDVRISPRSRNPMWNKAVLQRKLVERYVHVPALGNINYRDWNAPVEIKDLAEGLKHIELYLQSNPVILLCACSERDSCHRMTIVQACQHTPSEHQPERAIASASTPLDLETCRRIIDGGPAGQQMRMF